MKIIILLLVSLNTLAQTIYITGELESKNTQHVLMPLVPSFNGKISEMVAEGEMVRKGDFLLRIDGSTLNSQLETQKDDLENYKATSIRSEIEYKIQLNTAQMNFDSAKINYEIAQMQAQTPLDFIGELKYKQNQLQLKNTEKSYKKSIEDLTEKKIVIENSKQKVTLGIAQKQKKLDYLQNTLDQFTINANQEGYVIYSTHGWTGEKIQEGDQVQSGFQVMSVSQNIDLQIIANINAIDIPRLFIGQGAKVKFDAYLNQSYQAKIIKLSSGGSDKQIWGDALYYKATIELLDKVPNSLLLGMSAQVIIDVTENGK